MDDASDLTLRVLKENDDLMVDVTRQEDQKEEDYTEDWTEVGNESRTGQQAQGVFSTRFDCVIPSDLVYPKSQYEGWIPPLPVTEERTVLEELNAEWDRQLRSKSPVGDSRSRDDHTEQHIIFRLSNFSIYNPETTSSTRSGWDRFTPDFELESLHLLAVKRGATKLLVDGILSVGKFHRYVQRVPFETLTIEGYGDSGVSTVADKICVQSRLGKAFNIWYQLAEPSSEYMRFHEPFLWIADFTKHFVDYLLDHEEVALSAFRDSFYQWLLRRHGKSSNFRRWLGQFGGRKDFRTAVVAYIGFLWKECTDVYDHSREHPVWSEVDPEQLHAIKPAVNQYEMEKNTIVTPYIYDCFKNSYFAKCLEPRWVTDPSVLSAQLERKVALGFTTNSNEASSHTPMTPEPLYHRSHNIAPRRIKVGDVVGISRDEDSAWMDNASLWYAYVQGIHKNRKGVVHLDVIWLYSPCQTILSTMTMTYPIRNELFFSDNCNCGNRALLANEVVCKVYVEFFPCDLNSRCECIVRQKYCADEHAFVTLRKADFMCSCKSTVKKSRFEKVLEKHSIGDTVLITQDIETSETAPAILEPVVIADFVLGKKRILTRRLLHRGRDFNHAAARPNELVWTDQLIDLPAYRIERKCHIRFYPSAAVRERHVPPPYNRDGTADCFYIITQAVLRDGRLTTEDLLEPFPDSMTQGFDPTKPPPLDPVNSLDLFNGLGNFGRGMEEGGVLQNKWAVDINSTAMHSYRANLKDPDQTQLFVGSVDDYLAIAISGRPCRLVARVGEVCFILAGSPCQGFSNLQRDKQSVESLQNASKVASVASFIDHYRPKYALLENVKLMASPVGGKKDQNVFSQLLCALVGMGYQAQPFNVDAWSYGGSQSRSRLFIAIAAPGLKPIPPPPLTHSHPAGVKADSLGKAINGQSFCPRISEPTPFEFVTVEQATSDLPDIGDSRVQACIPFPDHRTTRSFRPLLRTLIAGIPTCPPGQTLYTAVEQGVMSKPHIDYFEKQKGIRKQKGSKAYGRLLPNGLFPTITTAQRPHDGLTGNTLHWNQHRITTIMEARRAQGIPDEEVIVGSPAHQWKLIGNGVERHTGTAFGMSVRDALLSNLPDKPGKGFQQTLIERSESKIEEIGDTVAVIPSGSPEYKTVLRSLEDGREEIVHQTSVRKLEAVTVTQTVAIKHTSAVHKTKTTQRTDDTLEISSKTTIHNKTIETPLTPLAGPSKKPAALPQPQPPAALPPVPRAQTHRHVAGHKRRASDTTGPPIAKRTRSTGEAGPMPTNWSKVLERVSRTGRRCTLPATPEASQVVTEKRRKSG